MLYCRKLSVSCSNWERIPAVKTWWVEDVWRQQYYTAGTGGRGGTRIYNKRELLHSLAVVKIVLRSYLEKESLDVVSRRLLLEILSDRNDYLQIVDLFPPEKKEKIISKLLVLPR